MADDDLLRMPRQGQMAQEARPVEPPWWEFSPPAEFAVAGINRCRWCFGLLDRPRRSLAEVEHLRRVLKIDMTTPFDPPICDGCYDTVVGSALPDEKVQEVGAANHRPSNLLLQKVYGDQPK